MTIKRLKTARKAPLSRDDGREQAKRILVEIIRQSGGTFTLKTNLYKAFYHAHLKYAEHGTGYLSKWPIVRMPRGPGVHQAYQLLSELVSEGLLQVDDPEEFEGFSFATTKKSDSLPAMRPDEVKAIRYGVKCVSGKSASQVSEESHQLSRAWKAARNGDELNIYADASDDDTYKKRAKLFKRLSPLVDEAFGVS